MHRNQYAPMISESQIQSSFVINKPLREMTKEELYYITYELDQIYKENLNATLLEMQNRQMSLENKQKELTHLQKQSNIQLESVLKIQEKQNKAINAQKEQFSKLEKEMNVLSAQRYKGVKNKFMNKCKERVYALLEGKDTPDFILFSHAFFQKIYSDIAKQFNLDTWDSIPMDNYQECDSFFRQVERYRDTWYPSDAYFLERYRDLIKKRDNGFLAPERCRALTAFRKSIAEKKKIRFLKNGSIQKLC